MRLAHFLCGRQARSLNCRAELEIPRRRNDPRPENVAPSRTASRGRLCHRCPAAAHRPVSACVHASTHPPDPAPRSTQILSGSPRYRCLASSTAYAVFMRSQRALRRSQDGGVERYVSTPCPLPFPSTPSVVGTTPTFSLATDRRTPTSAFCWRRLRPHPQDFDHFFRRRQPGPSPPFSPPPPAPHDFCAGLATEPEVGFIAFPVSRASRVVPVLAARSSTRSARELHPASSLFVHFCGSQRGRSAQS